MKRDEIYYADLGENIGSEQNGIRPVLIIQNDKGNECSPTTIIAVLTTKNKCTYMPTHIRLAQRSNLKESTIALEQLRTIDKKRIIDKICTLSINEMLLVDKALSISLGIFYKK